MRPGVAGENCQKFCQVGSMLAHFSLLSASWTHFSRLAALVVAFGCFFDVLERSGGDLGALEAPFWRLLEAPRAYFSRLLCACVLCAVQML